MYPTAPSSFSRRRSYQLFIATSKRYHRKSGADLQSPCMDAPERYEQLIAYLSSHLPEPVEQLDGDDGALHFLGGDPPLVVAVLTETNVTISEFAA